MQAQSYLIESRYPVHRAIEDKNTLAALYLLSRAQVSEGSSGGFPPFRIASSELRLFAPTLMSVGPPYYVYWFGLHLQVSANPGQRDQSSTS